MKRLILSLAAICFLSLPSLAADPLGVRIGSLSLQLPLQDLEATYLFDAIHAQSLVGAETTVLRIWNVRGTFGGVTTVDGNGTPFLGADLDVSSVLKDRVSLGPVRAGIWGGRDFIQQEWRAGVKASIPLF